MIDYIQHGLLAIPLTFLALKLLSYMSEQPVTRGHALLWCFLSFVLGTVALATSATVATMLAICSAFKFMDKRQKDGNWLNKHI